MTSTWQLQEAKNKFSEVVNRALEKGAQIITRNGSEVAVVVSIEEYRKLAFKEEKLGDFFASSPLAKYDVKIESDRRPVGKAIEL